MRNFSVFLLCAFAFTAFCQVNTQSLELNSNSNANSNSNSQSISIPAVEETIKVEQEGSVKENKLQNKPATKNQLQENQDLKKELQGKDADDQINMSSSESALQLVTSTFTLAKQMASSQRSQRSPTVDQQVQMDNLVQVLEKSSPESFEYHYFKFVAGNYSVALVEHLKKAELLRPTNSDVHIQFVAYYWCMNEKRKALPYLEKLMGSGRLNWSILNYSKDLLRSVPSQGTLVTHGMEDSYACLYLQISEGIRTDVNVISLDLLQSEAVQKQLLVYGFNLPQNTTIDVAYLKEFCVQNNTRNIALSMTIPKEYLIPIQENLFVTGLVLEYKTDLSYQNSARNEYLWNYEFIKLIIMEASNEKERQLTANYLPMLLILRNTYKLTNETEKLALIEEVLTQVAVQSRKQEQIQKMKSSD
ncbi:MAG: hypothetical protein RL679_830 [Bacteroidota bacterium]|jgi:hypothetical protein